MNGVSSASPLCPAGSQLAPQIRDLIPEFVWGVGIESTSIAHLRVDQFEWTQHNRFWRDDFKRLRDELGINALRYALPWNTVEPHPGEFDWTIADERLHACKEMGIDLYLDVMHFGTPLWLKQAVGDPYFPEALERFSYELAGRYGGFIADWCPCNEPLVLALFSGDFGFWPPHARKWRGYMPVLSRVIQACSRAIRAIRSAQPRARILWCDHVENYKSRDETLSSEVRWRNLRRFLALDLMLGRVDRHHALFEWVTSYGMSDLDLEWFRLNPQSPDVLGIDYYPNSDWQLDRHAGCVTQRRSETPVGVYGVGQAYYNRYAIPLMLTESSIDGQPLNREIWLEETVGDCRRLRAEGVPMLGYFWWPMIDQVDWDGALTHRVGKIHEVGLYNLRRQTDGTLARHLTPLAKQFAEIASRGEERVGALETVALPAAEGDQAPPIRFDDRAKQRWPEQHVSLEQKSVRLPAVVGPNKNGNGHERTSALCDRESERLAASSRFSDPGASGMLEIDESKETDRYGIVVFSHLRGGFVWQRPQQFLSRFAKQHKILFIEEPVFDQAEASEPRLDYHRVMPNVTVVTPHVPGSWNRSTKLPQLLLKFAKEAIASVNENGGFQRPLLWYYSPMDSAWSIGHIENRGIVYDCMDELSQFSSAPGALVDNERRLMEYADIVFTGGHELAAKKKQVHDNVHMFGCGVEFDHFNKAADRHLILPPDIDFMSRPILGWFGVIDERVHYAMIAEIARERPNWSIAMIGPVVKMDPNLLPHAPNLFWMGNRDYQQLPAYCAAFDVCMMCFAMNRSTQYINPTKGLEYMATGKPVISTPVRDVVKQWSHIVRIANNSNEFVAAVEDALGAGQSDPRIAMGLELARKSSWEATVERMQELIKGSIAPKERRSARPVTPVEANLEYIYCATQGS
jgi:beta-glucosidase/6-phospho-beta-glucosidase/beta-galactosidase/glycosyltransferase involved in cell wall biosynthesis